MRFLCSFPEEGYLLQTVPVTEKVARTHRPILLFQKMQTKNTMPSKGKGKIIVTDVEDCISESVAMFLHSSAQHRNIKRRYSG